MRKSCVNRSSYANNLETIEFSHNTLDFVYCHNVSFRYLTNFTANYAKLTGWHKALFARIPLKYFHLKGARGLAPFLQNDHLGVSFSSAPGLEVLDISGIGLSYFGNSLMFANHTNLTHLHLQNNNLHSWNLSFGGHSALETLDLRHNRIEYMEVQFRTEIEQLVSSNQLKVYMEGNDVDC